MLKKQYFLYFFIGLFLIYKIFLINLWIDNNYQIGPHGDGWSELNILYKIFNNEFNINDLIWSHGDHRPLTTRFFLYIDLKFFNGSNTFSNIRGAFLVLAIPILIGFINNENKFNFNKKLIIPLVITLIFTTSINFLGEAVLPIMHPRLLLYFFLIINFYFFVNYLEKNENKFLILTLLFSSICTWTMSSGLMVWVIIFLFLILHKVPIKKIFIFLTLAFINCFFYFRDWHSKNFFKENIINLDIIDFLTFFFQFLSNPLGLFQPLLGLFFGLIFFFLSIHLIYVFLNSHKTNDKIDKFYSLLLQFAFIQILLVCIARYQLPQDALKINDFNHPAARFKLESYFWLLINILIYLKFYFYKNEKLYLISLFPFIIFILFVEAVNIDKTFNYPFKKISNNLIHYSLFLFDKKNKNNFDNNLNLFANVIDDIDGRPGIAKNAILPNLENMKKYQTGLFNLEFNKLIDNSNFFRNCNALYVNQDDYKIDFKFYKSKKNTDEFIKYKIKLDNSSIERKNWIALILDNQNNIQGLGEINYSTKLYNIFHKRKFIIDIISTSKITTLKHILLINGKKSFCKKIIFK